MAKKLIKKLNQYVFLYRDPASGLAWIEDSRTGLGYSCHANIDETGNVDGMKALGHWSKSDRTVRSHGFIYNIDTYVAGLEIPYEQIAADACMCAACKERKGK